MREADEWEIDKPMPPRVVRKIQEVCSEHGVSWREMSGPSRKPRIARARHAAIQSVAKLESRVYPGTRAFTLAKMGDWFNRDHSVIAYAIRKGKV